MIGQKIFFPPFVFRKWQKFRKSNVIGYEIALLGSKTENIFVNKRRGNSQNTLST
jgi:hypothetical protein